MKIQQVSTLTARGADLLATVMPICPIFEFAEYRIDTSFFLNTPDKSNFTNSAARAENAPAQRDAQVPNPVGASQALYSRELAVDDVRKMDARVNGSNVGLINYNNRQLKNMALKIGTEVQDHMLIGAGATNQMLGLSNFVKDSNAAGQTAALGFTTTEQASMLVNAGSLAVNTTANENALVELIQSTMFQVPNANAILGSRNMIARLTSIAERRRMLGSMITEFGTLIMTFNGVPLVPLPVTALPTTESDGTNANCSSIYIARFAEEQGVCWITNSGFYFQDFQDAEVQPQGIARLQFFTNLSVERVDALRRISRIVL